MNNYGIKWAHIGLGGLFERLRQRYVGRVASVLFPHLGGSSLDHEHSYLVHYDTQSDQEGLDVHHDSCDITFNAALDDSSSYAGAGLTFCGLYSTPLYRNYSFTVRPFTGRPFTGLAPRKRSLPCGASCTAHSRALCRLTARHPPPLRRQYRHVLGRAILYDGRVRHGAEPIEAGSRTNLVHARSLAPLCAQARHHTPPPPRLLLACR